MGCSAFTCTGTDCPLAYDLGALPGRYHAFTPHASDRAHAHAHSSNRINCHDAPDESGVSRRSIYLFSASLVTRDQTRMPCCYLAPHSPPERLGMAIRIRKQKMAEAHTFAPLTDSNPQGTVARCIFEARDVFMWMRAGATHARLAISVEATKAVALALALDSRSICLWRKKAKLKNSGDDGIVRVNERHQSVQ